MDDTKANGDHRYLRGGVHADLPDLPKASFFAPMALFCSKAPTALVTVGCFLGLT